MISSLLNYIGHKSKIVEMIFKHLPENIDGTFYDIFSGSCVIGLNAPYPNITCVEKNEYLSNLYGHLEHPDFHKTLTNIITRYNLTNSSVTPRSEYLKQPGIGTVQWMGQTIPNLHLDKLNEVGYKKIITDFNSGKFSDLEKSVAYMIATIYGRNSSVTTKPNGQLSGGPGPLDFSLACNRKFQEHLRVLRQGRHTFVCDSFENIRPSVNDFCYFDPPYLSSSFLYQGWTEADEKKLLEYIDGLPCNWAISNSLQSGTKINHILTEWSQDKVVVNINKTYRKWAGSGTELTTKKNKINKEVLILKKNYRDFNSNGLFEF